MSEILRWLGWTKASAPAARPRLCATCLAMARGRRLQTVYVYRNGHMLRAGGDVPSLDAWPASNDLTTFCGLDIYGMGRSTLYALTGTAGDEP